VASSWFLIVAVIALIMGPRVAAAVPDLGNLSYVAGAAFAVLLYVSVLLHEIAHAVAARGFQMHVHAIHLHFLGGATEIEGEASSPWREFVIAVVGPLTSLLIGAAAWVSFVALEDGLLRFTIASLAGANLVVGVLNLIPGLPLDGGRILQAAVWAVSRRRRLGTVVAAWGGRVAAVLAIAWPVTMPLFGLTPDIIDYLVAVIVGAFLWSGATQALKVTAFRSALPGLVARDLARPVLGVPGELPAAEGLRRAHEAGARALVVLSGDGVPVGVVDNHALEATPANRLPWIPVSDLSRRVDTSGTLGADLAGEDLVAAMRRHPASAYVVVEPDGSLRGVLLVEDVTRFLDAGRR